MHVNCKIRVIRCRSKYAQLLRPKLVLKSKMNAKFGLEEILGSVLVTSQRPKQTTPLSG